jgi:hypothetical protein
VTDPGQIVALYRQTAIQHGAGTNSGDYRSTNKAADKLRELREQLREAGDDAQLALTALFEDENPSVRLWAARDCLSVVPERAVEILRDRAGAVWPGIAGCRDDLGAVESEPMSGSDCR